MTARVSGSELYDIDIKIKPLSKPHWQTISSQCAGKIASVLELLQGRLSRGVMEIITQREQGLFPKPSEISLDCSCPDWADMCKHVAAALYGVGARLDEKPELLFVLRQVDHMELIEQADAGKSLAPTAGSDKKTIADEDLAEVFGIEVDTAGSSSSAPSPAQDTTAEPLAGKAARTQIRKPAAGRRSKESTKPLGAARRSVPPDEAAEGKAKRGARVSQTAAHQPRKRPKAI